MSKRTIYPPGYKFKGGAVLVRELIGVFNRAGKVARMALCICPFCKKQWRTGLTNIARGFVSGCHPCCHVRRKTHEMSYAPIYRIWAGMIQRCNNQNAPYFRYYGARGIKVCKRWLTFENFYKDMGDRPSGRSLDRINNDGDYKPSNCRWATKREQYTNTRRNRFYLFNGKMMILSDIARARGMNLNTFFRRLYSGMPIEEAIWKPVRKTRRFHPQTSST